MALHDNPLWILSHIQNSFVVSDTTGNSELVLTNDNKSHLPILAEKHGISAYLDKALEITSNSDEDDEDECDGLSRSIEIRIGRNLRPRCNTERKLEKLKHDRSKQNDVQTISWKESEPIEGNAVENLFPKKVRKPPTQVPKVTKRTESLLSQKIANEPAPIDNPFADYSICDASVERPENSVSVRVFLGDFQDDKETPRKGELPPFIEGRVQSGTLVKDLIGFICWKYVLEERIPPLNSDSIEGFNLYLADSDGSIDWDLRPIEKLEPISKFGFSDYALVNVNQEGNFTATLDVKVTLPDGTYTVIQLPSRDITAKGLIEKVLARHKLRQRSGVQYQFFLEAKVCTRTITTKRYFVKSTTYVPSYYNVVFTNFFSLVVVSEESTVWKLRKFTLTLFWQKFRESKVLL